MNPIARAIARNKLAASMVDMKIMLYMADDGQAMSSVLTEISRLMTTTLMAARDSKVTQYVQEINSVLVELCNMMDDDYKWRKAAVVRVDDALDAVLIITPKLKPDAINNAVHTLAAMVLRENKEREHARATVSAATS